MPGFFCRFTQYALVQVPCAVVLSALLLAGCQSSPTTGLATNQPPRIDALSASRVTLAPKETSELLASVSDLEGDAVTVQWSSMAGTFSSPTALSTTFSAPESAGLLTIYLQAMDPFGASAMLSFTISVVAVSVDLDGDGYSPADGDCYENNADVWPGATELPDGLDNDCDGLIDEDSGVSDLDGDGFSANQGDCNDADPLTYPGAQELASDPFDNNCDGTINEGSSDSDDDLDGYSEAEGDCDDQNPTRAPNLLEQPDDQDNDCNGIIDENTVRYDDDGDGWSELDGDCDDLSAVVSPSEIESPNGHDDNCDGQIDEQTSSQDLDLDSYSTGAGDCNDANALIYPSASELADGLDNDCDTLIDEGTSLFDDDKDGLTEQQGDCADANSAIFPGAIEYADGLDNDCDGQIDEGTNAVDDDLDGFSENQGDCHDASSRARPGYPEVPDELDNDCDGTIDEKTVLADQDGDLFRVLDGDCDDSDPLTFPGAIDYPDDGKKNDCNGVPLNVAPEPVISLRTASMGCSAIVLDASSSTDAEGQNLEYFWYIIEGLEASLDSPTQKITQFSWMGAGPWRIGLAVSDGDLTSSEVALELDANGIEAFCMQDTDLDGLSPSEGDCDDENPAIFPGATEVCDGIDQDCDGRELLLDESFDAIDPDLWWLYGSAEAVDGQIALTSPIANQAGSVFYALPIELTSFTLRTSLLLDGGTAGEGMTVAFIDKATSSLLGEGGAGLGVHGLVGWAIEFDSSYSSEFGDPTYHHVALIDPLSMNPALIYRASVRVNEIDLELRYDGGIITVIKNDLELFSESPTWPLPDFGYIGLTAATSDRNTDYHFVQHVTLECGVP